MRIKYLFGPLFAIFSLTDLVCEAKFVGDSPIKSAIAFTNEEPPESSYLKLANDIQRYAKKFIGIPYKSGGKASKGFDCSGFVGYVFKKFDMKLGACCTEMYKLGYNIETKEALAGDLIFFSSFFKRNS
jgi:cell wall-associated NlpC family hydrolase